MQSTGDSLDEDDKLTEARRNTTYNEVIDADNPQTPEEGAQVEINDIKLSDKYNQRLIISEFFIGPLIMGD